MNEKRKKGKVIKSKRWGSKWTREEQRRKGGTPAPRGVVPAKAYVFRLSVRCIHPSIRAHLVTMISKAYNLQGIFTSPYWRLGYILEIKGQRHSKPSSWWRHPCRHYRVKIHLVQQYIDNKCWCYGITADYHIFTLCGQLYKYVNHFGHYICYICVYKLLYFGNSFNFWKVLLKSTHTAEFFEVKQLTTYSQY